MADQKINVVIGADTKGLDRGLSRARANVAKFAKIGAAAFGAMAVAVVALTKRSLANIDVMAKQARSLGLTSKALQAMTLVANEAGVSTGALSSMLGLMQRNIIELGKGTKAQEDAFNRLGISIKDLNGLSADEQFDKIATALNTIVDPATRTATAMDIFGRSGRGAINMLDGYSGKVKEAAAWQEKFNVAVSDEGAAKVESANDAVDRLRSAFSGLGNILAVAVAPALEAAAKAITTVVGKVSEFVKWMVSGPKNVNLMTQAIDNQTAAEYDLNVALGNVVAGNQNSAATAVAAAQANIVAAKAAYDRAKAELTLAASIVSTQKVEASAARSMAEDVPFPSAFAQATLGQAKEDFSAAEDYFDEMLDLVDKQLLAVKTAVAKVDTVALVTSGVAAGGFDPNRPFDNGDGKDPKDKGKGGGAMADALADRLEALVTGLMTEREVLAVWYEESQLTLAEALEQEKLTTSEHKDAMLRLEQEYQERLGGIKDAGNKFGLQSTLKGGAQILGAMGSFNKKALKVSQAFAAAEALVSTFQGAAKELARGGTLGFPMAAAVIAKGLAFVGAIKGASAGGGGGGGAVGATAAVAAPPQQISRHVTVDLGGGVMFSGDQVRSLINQLNEAVEDGASMRMV